MAIVYVAKTGLDTNNGLTPATAKLTVGGANSALTTGDNTIYIGIGEYTENPTIGTTAKFVNIIGDYDGTIFGTIAGVVMFTRNSYIYTAYVKSITRTNLKVTNNEFINGHVSADFTLTFNYVEFICLVSQNCYLFNNNNFIGKVIMNYCSYNNNFLGYAINASQSEQYYGSGQLVLNNCDFMTKMSATLSRGFQFDTISELTVNDSSILLCSNGFSATNNNVFFNNCIVKRASGWVNLLVQNSNTSSTKTVGLGSIYKNCSFIDSNNVSINMYNLLLIPGNTSGNNNKYNNTNYARINWIYYAALHKKVILDNANNSGLVYRVKPGVFFRDLNEQYLSNSVWQVYNEASFVNLIPINIQLMNNTQYKITLDYHRYNIQSGHFAIAIVEGQVDQRDVYNEINGGTGPSITKNYMKLAGSSEPINTWYTKELIFTTDADILSKKYYIMFVNTTSTNDMKMTIPRISLV